MQKVSYIGNGATTEFTFNFPYFINTDIIVTVNNITATGYNIIGNSGGLDADIPYIGGKVVFDTAPTAMDTITIARHLPLTRTIDYQPLVKLDPTTLNQDMNYTMEILKDFYDDLADFKNKYQELTDMDSVQNLISKLDTVQQSITDLGDVSQIRTNISGLQDRCTSLENNSALKDLSNVTADLSDIVAMDTTNATDISSLETYTFSKSGWLLIATNLGGSVQYSSSLYTTDSNSPFIYGCANLANNASSSLYRVSKNETITRTHKYGSTKALFIPQKSTMAA